MIGQTLAHYRITAALGAGGMGEVYRATDTKLGRDVAIKVLPPEVAQDHERLERFRREAHVLASLNHPNIAAIYGLEETDGKPFLVLELVEGEDLLERLRRGPLLVEEAIETARQVAEGLEAAHEAGVIHRDLKPANVKLTPDGQVKVLDFGLAKTYASPAASGSASAVSQSPTLAHSGTQAGVILGTAAYMSPEQASGRTLDKRTDVWSFGVLAFEMLAGRGLFTGATVAEILASILRDDPPWETLPPDCPPALTSLLRRCLRRRSRERLHDIGDARLELEDLQTGRDGGAGARDADEGVAAATWRRRVRRERRVWATGLLVASGLAVALAVFNFTATPEARPAAHLVIETPEEVSVGTALGFITLPSVSPDGRQVIFVGRARGSPPQLWIRPLETPEVRALAETEGASLPFWSPDGRQIAFAAEGALKKLTLDGGRVERICVLPAGAFAGGTWNETGTIVFSSGYTGLYAVAAAGGEVQPLTTLDEPRGERSHRAPQFLPDGRHVLFEVSNERRDENLELHVTSIEAPDEERRQLVDDRPGTYSSGHLLFVRGGTLFAQPFDPGRLEVSGEAVRVVEDVGSWRQGNLGVFGTSSNGVLAYLDRGHLDVRLMWVNREGEWLGGLGKPDRYGQISLSPDGRHVVTEIRGNRGHDLWVIDVSRGVASRATNDPVNETDAVWSPDGEELVFAMHGEGGPHLFRKNLRQGTPPTPLLETPGSKWPEDWSAHGDTVLYFSGGAFWALSLAADGPPKSVLTTGSGQDEVQLSPDGRWLAYTSNLSGDWETYVEPFQRPGERVRASMNGGGQPQWRADGRELFFVSRRNMLTAVPIQEGAAGLELGPATELFEVPMAGRPQLNGYGVASDGERFLVKVPVEGDAGERLHVVTDWTSLLE